MREVVIVDYDPRWPQLFAAEAVGLGQAFGPALLRLEHVGSTSVPGLAAKPIVDVQAVVRSVPEADRFAPVLAAMGWEQGVFTFDTRPRLYFKKHDGSGVRTHQLHVYEPTNPAAADHRLFRDYLRAHADEAKRYVVLKRVLAGQFKHDPLGYSKAKTDHVQSVLRKARG